MMLHLKNHHGFTFIELIMVLMIVSIIAAISSVLLLQGTEAYYNGQNVLASYWQGEIAMQLFARDVTKIRSNNDITTATPTNLVFTDMHGNTDNYLLSSNSLTLNGYTLANRINLSNSFFTYYDNTLTATNILTDIYYIQIQISLTNSNYILINTLYLRNVQ